MSAFVRHPVPKLQRHSTWNVGGAIRAYGNKNAPRPDDIVVCKNMWFSHRCVSHTYVHICIPTNILPKTKIRVDPIFVVLNSKYVPVRKLKILLRFIFHIFCQ